MKLGSLFDGIGGFPLSAAMCGVEPVQASEIEPFPILVTHKRFPNMKHLGNISGINGAEIEPVDIITFGSPCQDLSVAGKQAGIHEGARSNLFFEAVRIIKWTENLAVPDPTIEEVEFFTKVWADWAEINGTKPKSLNQVIKWLADPQSDSAEYKAYGNSLAIPCSYDVLRRITQNA